MALGTEVQNVLLDQDGRFSVLLGLLLRRMEGASHLFSSGEPRWLGIQGARVGGGGTAQSVAWPAAPYALKAGDADTVRGLPVFSLRVGARGGTCRCWETTGSPRWAGQVRSFRLRNGKSSPQVDARRGRAGRFVDSFDNGSPTSPAIAITSLGRVGIGTTNPQTSLNVIGSEGGFQTETHPHCQ